MGREVEMGEVLFFALLLQALSKPHRPTIYPNPWLPFHLPSSLLTCLVHSRTICGQSSNYGVGKEG